MKEQHTGAPIQIGDPLTVGAIPGIAVKAQSAGPIVGTALEALDAIEQPLSKKEQKELLKKQQKEAFPLK